MLMGFISLLMTVFQGNMGKLCISKNLANKWLPCDNKHTILDHHISQRLLSEGTPSNYCHTKDKVALLSVTALHHLHIFIFVLAVVHVSTCALTILFGGLKIKQWQRWEQSIQGQIRDLESDEKYKVTLVNLHDFLKNRSRAINYSSLGWLQAFLKQFYGSVTKSDYITMRKGFIIAHCKSNPGFDFYRYMVRAFESDFKKVVGISWFLWLFVVVFLFVNVNGYHVFFWIAFIPLILLLGVGTKLEHIIIQLARQVAQRHTAVVGNDVEIQPSDDHFWFRKPRIVLLFIHIILFQNSFELAFFFWIWVQYGFDSCIMGSIGYTAPRLVIAVFVQFLCSYSTLPLYAIVTQMGSSFNKAIFEDHIQESIIDWAHTAKKTTSVPAVRVLAKRTQSLPAMRLNNDNQGVPNQNSGLSHENPIANIQQHSRDSVVREIEHEHVQKT
ncbi:hypothetical protein RND81_05G134900 [Saponaria officinalis]